MAVRQRMDLRQTQTLVMTPQLQQAIKLLQLSRLELQQAIREELEINPVLEESQEGVSDGEEAAGREDEPPEAVAVPESA